MTDRAILATLADHPGVSIEVERRATTATHPEALAATQTLVDRFESRYAFPSPKSEEWFSWIPLRLELFFEGVLHARELLATSQPYERPLFLDVGSGIGSKCALAHELGFEAHGIELHEPYLDACRQLFPYVTATLDNAAEFDSYGDYDLVYGYGVAASIEHQAAIDRRIAKQLHRGALFFAPRMSEVDAVELEPVGHCVWRKT